MRRESLLDEADAREKRTVGNSAAVSNRIVYERKLENLSNRKKQAKLVSLLQFNSTSKSFIKEHFTSFMLLKCRRPKTL